MTTTTQKDQGQLAINKPPEPEDIYLPFAGPCALEDDHFPFEFISEIAEAESWRKDINRPIYHIHKWWAHRLGSVFRSIVLGALTPSGTDVLTAFYRPSRIKGATVFDPFMGSGTTIGEAAKLGVRAIGRDINPVAHFLVCNALASHDRDAVMRTFRDIERDIASKICAHYKSTLSDGTKVDVLYYFWVKQVACPECSISVDLFSTRIFAKHAYPKRYPEAKAVCPACGEINSLRYDAVSHDCMSCETTFDPQAGPAKGQKAICPSCHHDFPIAKTIREQGAPAAHRLYAKMVLTPEGKKSYLAATEADRKSYLKAEEALAGRDNAYPVVQIQPGYNTNQALGYNYKYWHQMFNSRQLLCLSMLADRIREIPDPVLRNLFTCLFSGALEFNNLFASFKGEGTGAVRHMFAHHILKPERVPLEANVWGTSKSSGSFLTMFEGRIRRALDYAENPFELRLFESTTKKPSEKIYGLSEPLGIDVAEEFKSFQNGKKVYLSCGDSGDTDINDGSVDAIITDPPFFDNVHYSQLADFFHVWQRHILGDMGTRLVGTTRSVAEVQNAEVGIFTERLASVWAECCRVLSDQGVLVFTYHHSRLEGWHSVLQALMQSGFSITAVHPIKAEMSVAMPKHQAKEPINLDIIIVCRKRSSLNDCQWNGDLWRVISDKAAGQVKRLRVSGRKLSRNDVRIIVMAQLIMLLSRSYQFEAAMTELETNALKIESTIQYIYTLKNPKDNEAET